MTNYIRSTIIVHSLSIKVHNTFIEEENKRKGCKQNHLINICCLMDNIICNVNFVFEIMDHVIMIIGGRRNSGEIWQTEEER